jgi:hypothetical protein
LSAIHSLSLQSLLRPPRPARWLSLRINGFALHGSIVVFDNDEAPIRFIDDLDIDALSSWQVGLLLQSPVQRHEQPDWCSVCLSSAGAARAFS